MYANFILGGHSSKSKMLLAQYSLSKLLGKLLGKIKYVIVNGFWSSYTLSHLFFCKESIEGN